MREDARPFGGIQLVLSGDFFQLPPVSRRDEAPKKFCFEAKTWELYVLACMKCGKRIRSI